eukprot:CAMPEP_0194532854 /NCGR_PEP_ID=MMETSP0253-20130528/70564_1 /TAXON_ID=2966 /ORGANISM="Noctiluca scintillans" /LENGTH=132 /DNA_ID=CAMNT_0039378351 /DNA_START=238 /DNA_END=637 /DNA_ORIENTATION=+
MMQRTLTVLGVAPHVRWILVLVITTFKPRLDEMTMPPLRDLVGFDTVWRKLSTHLREELAKRVVLDLNLAKALRAFTPSSGGALVGAGRSGSTIAVSTHPGRKSWIMSLSCNHLSPHLKMTLAGGDLVAFPN